MQLMPRFRIRISNLLMGMLCIAILLSWYRDRQLLHAQFDAVVNPKPSWGNCQAEGPPDTPKAGDIPTAWASQTPDGQTEWLVADYQIPIHPKAIEVHETYNPGAVTRISGLDGNGNETTLWEGTETIPAGASRNVSIFTIHTKKRFRRYKICIDSPNFPGWNEIDAIGVRTKRGTKWASRVTSSSSYGAARVVSPFRFTGNGIF